MGLSSVKNLFFLFENLSFGTSDGKVPTLARPLARSPPDIITHLFQKVKAFGYIFRPRTIEIVIFLSSMWQRNRPINPKPFFVILSAAKDLFLLTAQNRPYYRPCASQSFFRLGNIDKHIFDML